MRCSGSVGGKPRLRRALVVAVVVVSVCLAGLIVYGIARPALSEEEVVGVVQEYLIGRAQEVPPHIWMPGYGLVSETALVMDWGFMEWGLAAVEEFRAEGGACHLVCVTYRVGEKEVERAVCREVLEKVARYDGNGLWTVSMDGEWRVDERTGEVTPADEGARLFLQDTSLRTYHDAAYGYYVDYPPSWAVSQLRDGYVLIVCPEPQTDVLIGRPNRLLTGQTLEEYSSGFASFLAEQKEGFELIGLGELEGGDYRLEFNWMVGGARIQSIVYLVLQDAWVYTISASTPAAWFESYAYAFEHIYRSFGLSRVE